MYPTSPFLVRRVLLGVVVGLALLAVGFFAWTRYRVAQYHHRESAVVTRYRGEYQQCRADGTAAANCARGVQAACARDAFWLQAKPFDLALDRGGGSDVTVRCRMDAAAPP